MKETAVISEETTRSRQACKRLIQYMHANDLAEGSRLPPQQELRTELKFANTTLSKAMGSMVRHGLVRRRRRTGTRVADRDAMIPDLWTVALPIFSHGEMNDLFVTTLLRCMQGELSEAGCRWRCYRRQADPDAHQANRLADFEGLESDLTRRRVDAVLSPALLNESDVRSLGDHLMPVCHVVSLENFACGVGIDQRSMIADAIGQFVAHGCEKLALVSGEGLISGCSPMAVGAFTQAVEATGGRITSAELLAVSGPATRDGGRRLCEMLLRREASRRPDGLIVLADLLGVGLCDAAAKSGYRPRVAVQTNRLVPLSFALPTAQYEVDVPRMAGMGVRMILQRMRSPRMADAKRWVEPLKVVEKISCDEDIRIIERQLMPAAV